MEGAGNLLAAAQMAKSVVNDQAETIKNLHDLVEKLTLSCKAAEKAVGLKESIVEKTTQEKTEIELEVEQWRKKGEVRKRGFGDVLIYN